MPSRHIHDARYSATRVRPGHWRLTFADARDADVATFDTRLPAYVRHALGDDLGPLVQFGPTGPVEVFVERGERLAWSA